MVKILDRKELLKDIEVILLTEDDSKLAELHSNLVKDHKTEFSKEDNKFVQNEVDWLIGVQS